MTIYVGDSIDIPIEIYDTGGNLADPGTLRAVVRDPDGNQEEFTYPSASWVRTGVGEYVFTTPPFDQARDWWVLFETTGAGVVKTAERMYPVCGLHVSLAAP
jgi:hypothetical protein